MLKSWGKITGCPRATDDLFEWTRQGGKPLRMSDPMWNGHSWWIPQLLPDLHFEQLRWVSECWKEQLKQCASRQDSCHHFCDPLCWSLDFWLHDLGCLQITKDAVWREEENGNLGRVVNNIIFKTKFPVSYAVKPWPLSRNWPHEHDIITYIF